MVQKLDDKLADALNVMKDAGFNVDANVQVAVDEKLPFMGYTSNSWNKHVIVVAGFALQSPMLNGLLLHELSHIYRQTTNHPSHNSLVITNAAETFTTRHSLRTRYQHEILHQIINHLQDLYADDITIKVINRNQQHLFRPDTMFQFFYDWLKDEPIKSLGGPEGNWRNAALLLSNSFAISNMQRHGILDIDSRAKTKNNTLLAQVNSHAAEHFSYFNHLMVTMPEEISEHQYERLLAEYLEQFFRLTEEIQS